MPKLTKSTSPVSQSLSERIFHALYVVLVSIKSWRVSSQRSILYIKRIPFYQNIHKIRIVKTNIRFLLVGLLIIFLSVFIFRRYINQGIDTTYSLFSTDKNISDLGPPDRVSVENKNGEKIIEQKDDVIYFSTNVPVPFDTAKIKITFQNPSSTHDIRVGFKDLQENHYTTQIIDAPLLNQLNWHTVSKKNLVLYEREKTYASPDELLQHPPTNKIIGTYNYMFPQTYEFPDENKYKPKTDMTNLDIVLRGGHTLYAYLKNEPFKLEFQKQDLNWYTGLDPLTVKIYKDDMLVYSKEVADDGIDDNSGQETAPQTISFQNPGPGLPEPGLYKIVFDTSSDVIIKQIKTNLHKIVFQGPLFLANNSDIYPSVTKATTSTILFSNAQMITATAKHSNAIQNLTVDKTKLPIKAVNIPTSIVPKDTFYSITIPKNDTVVTGLLGYFSLTEDQFFNPSKYYVLPITNQDTLDLADYIIADYHPPVSLDNNWKVAEKVFTLDNADVENKQIRWIIQSPHLRENGQAILIKDIEITFHKNPVY